MNEDADYIEVFGQRPEAWRIPLGALRITLSGDKPTQMDWERARSECEDLVKVLNGVEE